MLTINPTQLARLGAAHEQTFRTAVAALLREKFPEYAINPDDVSAFVAVATADANTVGVKSARGIAVYTILAFLLGLDVKDEPRFVQAIRMSGLNEADKVAWMTDWLGSIAEALDS